jgi:hypothetical protein
MYWKSKEITRNYQLFSSGYLGAKLHYWERTSPAINVLAGSGPDAVRVSWLPLIAEEKTPCTVVTEGEGRSEAK